MRDAPSVGYARIAQTGRDEAPGTALGPPFRAYLFVSECIHARQQYRLATPAAGQTAKLAGWKGRLLHALQERRQSPPGSAPGCGRRIEAKAIATWGAWGAERASSRSRRSGATLLLGQIDATQGSCWRGRTGACLSNTVGRPGTKSTSIPNRSLPAYLRALVYVGARRFFCPRLAGRGPLHSGEFGCRS